MSLRVSSIYFLSSTVKANQTKTAIIVDKHTSKLVILQSFRLLNMCEPVLAVKRTSFIPLCQPFVNGGRTFILSLERQTFNFFHFFLFWFCFTFVLFKAVKSNPFTFFNFVCCFNSYPKVFIFNFFRLKIFFTF